MHSVRRIQWRGPTLSPIPEIEIKHISPNFSDIKITKNHLESYFIVYKNSTRNEDYPPSMRIINNLTKRYQYESDCLSEQDVEILVCTIKMSLESRDEGAVYLHESLLDDMITSFKLQSFFDKFSYFSFES